MRMRRFDSARVAMPKPPVSSTNQSIYQSIIQTTKHRWASGLAHAYGRRADVINRGFSGYTSRYVCLCVFCLIDVILYCSWYVYHTPHEKKTTTDNTRWCALMLESLFPLADPEWEKPLVAIVFVGANDAALPSRQQHGRYYGRCIAASFVPVPVLFVDDHTKRETHNVYTHTAQTHIKTHTQFP